MSRWWNVTPVPMYSATRASLISGVIIGVVFLPVWYYRAPILVPGHILVFSIVAAALVILRAVKFQPWRDTAAAWLFILANFTILAGCVFNHEHYIREQMRFEPFVGAKALAVFIPLLAPPRRWVGWTVLVALAIVPVVQYYTWNLEARAELGIQEPWMTAVFVVVAGLTYELRLHVAEVRLRERVLAEKHHLMEKTAALLLGARHLMNTPLQTIETAVEVLETKEPAIVGRTERSFSTLRRTSEILSFAESFLSWDSLDLPGDTDELEFRAQEIRTLANEYKVWD